MPVSAVVAMLSADEALAAAAARACAGEPHVTVGPRAGPRLPLVLDTPTPEADREVWRRLQEVPGVVHLDLVLVHFDSLAAPEERP